MAILDEIDVCPRGPQPDSMTEQTCKINWKDVRRVTVQDVDGVDPFVDGQTTFAGVVTALQTESEWTDAIGLSDISKITVSPKGSDFQMPAVIIEAVQLPDQTFEMPGSCPSQVATKTFDGLSSKNHAKLMVMSGKGRRVLFILKDGRTVCKTLTDPQVVDQDSCFFETETFIVSTRQVQTGATELDLVNIVMTFPYDELVEFTIVDTSAFGTEI